MRARQRLDNHIDEVLSGQKLDKADRASRLGPLLEQAERLRELPTVEMPAPSVEALQRRVLDRADELRQRTISTVPRRRFPRAAYALVGLLAFFILIPTLTATASHSLPGDSLYPLKRAAERIYLALAPTPLERAERQVILIERRTAETEDLIEEKRALSQETLTGLATQTLDAVQDIEKLQDEAQLVPAQQLQDAVERQRQALNQVEEYRPEQAGLQDAAAAVERAGQFASSVIEKPDLVLPTPTDLPAQRASPTAAATETAAPTASHIAVPTAAPTQTPTANRTLQPTQTASATPTQTATATATPTQTTTPTATPSHEGMPTQVPTSEELQTLDPTCTAHPTGTPRSGQPPRATHTPRPTNTSRPTHTPKPTEQGKGNH